MYVYIYIYIYIYTSTKYPVLKPNVHITISCLYMQVLHAHNPFQDGKSDIHQRTHKQKTGFVQKEWRAHNYDHRSVNFVWPWPASSTLRCGVYVQGWRQRRGKYSIFVFLLFHVSMMPWPASSAVCRGVYVQGRGQRGGNNSFFVFLLFLHDALVCMFCWMLQCVCMFKA